ncbi:MAG: NAD(P)-dependent oxidoreductase, partial [Elsteraceae bacterium]
MIRPKVIVTNWVHDPVIARLGAIAEVEANPTREPWSPDEVRARCRDADALVAFMTDCVDADFLAACPRLKIIACALKGFDNFDVQAIRDAGVALSIVPDLLTEPTAELAVGLAIALGRNILPGDRRMRDGTFQGWRPTLYGFGLDGAVVGVIGLGAVGSAVAARLQGFGCRLIGHDPNAPAPPGVASCGLDELLAASDVIILAAPLTPATRHLIDRSAIAAMKPGARLVNVGRGSTVDERAVADALEAGCLAGYAADVFELEDWGLPDRPREVDPRLIAHPATVFTPHLGSAVDE